jgi:hypothetical protein
MKKIFNLIIISVLLAAVNATVAPPYQYKIKLFEVPLDHFSYSQNVTFNIR